QAEDLITGLGLFDKGVDSLVQRRMQQAQALAQAKMLKQAPQFQQTLGTQSDEQVQSAVGGLSSENFLKNLQDPTIDMQIVDALTGEVTPLGKTKKTTKSFMVPRANPIPSDYVTPSGQPTILNPRTKAYEI